MNPKPFPINKFPTLPELCKEIFKCFSKRSLLLNSAGRGQFRYGQLRRSIEMNFIVSSSLYLEMVSAYQMNRRVAGVDELILGS